MSQPIISASILSADFANLGQDVSAALEAGADQIHFDVMDFHYVPNLTFGPVVCKALRKFGIQAPIDVHLMVDNPENYIKPFSDAGANSLTIHLETTKDPINLLTNIRNHKMQTGIAINPKQPLQLNPALYPLIDKILIMTVEPGFGGQAFLADCLLKVTQACELREQLNLSLQLGVDGGIKTDNIGVAAKAGADYFVIGSGLFNTHNYIRTIQELRDQI